MIARLAHLGLWFSGFLILCLAYGFFVEPEQLRVRHVAISSPGWDAAPLRIGFVSDLHMAGDHIDTAKVERLTREMNAQAPDIVLIAGDFVNGSTRRHDHSAAFNASVDSGIAALSDLSAPLGVYASLGNHDTLYDPRYIADAVKANGIAVLENDFAYLEAQKVCVIGLEDEWYGDPQPSIIENCPEGSSSVIFMHNPDSFELTEPRPALLLAGHTHGGQINLPFIGRRVTSTRAGKAMAYGTLSYQGIPAFVTAGVGTSMLPARFRAPPEIVIITLSGPQAP